MEDLLQRAIELRKDGKHKDSRSLLTTLLSDNDYVGRANLHIAWSYDNEGKEREAVEHYLAALNEVISPPERFEALFGLASTYRSLGQYTEALVYFEKTIEEFPDAVEAKPFYAMCLYNLGRSKEATSLLLQLLISTTSSEAIKDYQRAISLYAEDLDRTW
ncbi:TPR repeat protein [Vibrio sp. JCM 19236]|nr:TPR repeat protein [Vibrio sp. JCM 19236]